MGFGSFFSSPPASHASLPRHEAPHPPPATAEGRAACPSPQRDSFSTKLPKNGLKAMFSQRDLLLLTCLACRLRASAGFGVQGFMFSGFWDFRGLAFWVGPGAKSSELLAAWHSSAISASVTCASSLAS